MPALFHERITEKILSYFKVKFNYRTLKQIPNSVIFASLVLSLSAISQFIADVVIEVSSAVGVIPYLDFRINFLALTFLSALIAYHTVIGIKRHELDVTEDAVQLSMCVELFLIIGDLYYLRKFTFLSYEWLIRMPFLILTTINIILVIYMIRRLELFKSE